MLPELFPAAFFMEVRSLYNISLDTLYEAWEDAFSDYPVTVTKPELEKMLVRRGYDPALSFGAFEYGRLVSFILNGTGVYNGQNTVYDTGTGTIKTYRGRGLVKKIFNESLPQLQKEGYTQYLLEVLQTNQPAISIYHDMGFTVSREFNYFLRPMEGYRLSYDLPQEYRIEEITEVNVTDMAAMCDFNPSWQNSFDSIQRCYSDFHILGVFTENVLAGYGISEPTSGDITQLSVHTDHRRKGIASYILQQLLKLNRCHQLKIINTDAACTSLTAFFEHNGIALSGKQYEMVKNIS